MQIGSKTLPELGPGQVLVRLYAAGVNPSDTYVRLGPEGPWAASPHLLPRLPFTPGKDGAGVVEALGPDSGAGPQLSQRVYTLGSTTGTYAELAVCNAADVHPLPDRVSFEEGACIGVPCSTAYRALVIRCGAIAGDRVFVHGASGAVGLAAVQLAVDMGCVVVGSASTPEGEAAVADAGAHFVVNHRAEGYLQKACAFGDGRRFNICLEMMASENLVADVGIMARHGRIAIIGSKAQDVAFNPRLTMPMELDIRGVFSPCATASEREATQHALFDAMDRGALRPPVAVRLPLAEAPQAHVQVMRPGKSGNVVLTIDGLE